MDGRNSKRILYMIKKSGIEYKKMLISRDVSIIYSKFKASFKILNNIIFFLFILIISYINIIFIYKNKQYCGLID